MNFLKRLYLRIKKHYSHPTLSEWMEKHDSEQRITIANCEKVIMLHEFQKHMAIATINAMVEWRSKKERE